MRSSDPTLGNILNHYIVNEQPTESGAGAGSLLYLVFDSMRYILLYSGSKMVNDSEYKQSK